MTSTPPGDDPRTQLQPARPERALQAATPALGLQAYQQAPTLMAGRSGEGAGPVQVWGPERKWALLALLVWVTLGAGTIAIAVQWHGYASLFQFCVWGGFGILAALSAALHPSYTTTDDNGISFTSLGHRQSYTWNEGRGWQSPNALLVATRPAGLYTERRELSLTGYSPAVRRQLVERIAERANLDPNPKHPTRKRISALKASPSAATQAPRLNQPLPPESLQATSTAQANTPPPVS